MSGDSQHRLDDHGSPGLRDEGNPDDDQPDDLDCWQMKNLLSFGRQEIKFTSRIWPADKA